MSCLRWLNLQCRLFKSIHDLTCFLLVSWQWTLPRRMLWRTSSALGCKKREKNPKENYQHSSKIPWTLITVPTGMSTTFLCWFPTLPNVNVIVRLPHQSRAVRTLCLAFQRFNPFLLLSQLRQRIYSLRLFLKCQDLREKIVFLLCNSLTEKPR